MKYFIDFEFLEGDVPCQVKSFNIPKWLIKPNNTIQPISVGICSSDGREYYAISKEFNLKEAWNRYEIKKEWYSIDESTQSTRDVKKYWLRDNVLKPIFQELLYKGHKEAMLELPKIDEKYFTYKNFKRLIKEYGKTNKQIAEEIIKFTSTSECRMVEKYGDKPEFYGYYADYDWVVFCWLFGKMIDLPKGFPMYCIDLKQTLDTSILTNFTTTFNYALDRIKKHPNYPKQTNEHNAIADARWNYELHKFLNKI